MYMPFDPAIAFLGNFPVDIFAHMQITKVQGHSLPLYDHKRMETNVHH